MSNRTHALKVADLQVFFERYRNRDLTRLCLRPTRHVPVLADGRLFVGLRQSLVRGTLCNRQLFYLEATAVDSVAPIAGS
jgi:hypothetical protein